MSDLLLLGADEDSAPHPQQDPPSLRLPRAGFNVGSASGGGRWGFCPPPPPPAPSRINPVYSTLSARAAHVPFNIRPAASAWGRCASGQHIGIEQTGYGCPGPVSMSDLLLLGADEDSAPHPQQDPPSLRLPRAGFNVGSASSGGRWGFCPPPPPPAPSRINPV